MEVKAKANQIRIAPQKVRLVADLIRGMETGKALGQLKFSRKRASEPMAKLVNSAIANATNNYDLDKDNLFIKEIRVDEGKTLHRWTPKAHGRATPVRKRSSHVSVVLAEIKDSGKKEAKKQEIEAPIKLGATTDTTEVGAKKATKKTKETGEEVVTERFEQKHGHGVAESGGTEGKGFIKKVFSRKSG